MDKQRVKIISKVFEEVKLHFPETIQFIEDCLEQECCKENGRGNFSFYMPRNKKLVQRNIFYFVVLGFKAETFLLHLTNHVKLNSQAMIFISV